MSKKLEAPRRSEITEKIDESGELMDEQEDAADEAASDVETTERTLDDLDLGTTADGAEQVERHLQEAGDQASGEFSEHERELQDLHEDGADHERELDEREQGGESDLDRADDAKGELNSAEVLSRVEQAVEAIREDIAFLKEESERSRRNREESEQLLADLRDRLGLGA
jgi:hypothetical protein